MLQSATFAFLRHQFFAMERNFCTTLADFGLFLVLIIFHFGEIWGQFGTFEHP